VIKLSFNNAYIRRVDKLEAELLLVVMDHFRRFPDVQMRFLIPDSPTKAQFQKPKVGQVKNATTTNKPNLESVGVQRDVS